MVFKNIHSFIHLRFRKGSGTIHTRDARVRYLEQTPAFMLEHTHIRARLLPTVKPPTVCLRNKLTCAAIPTYRPLISVGRPIARPLACSAVLSGGTIVDLEHLQLPILSGMLDSGEQYALLLSTLAGLSTQAWTQA